MTRGVLSQAKPLSGILVADNRIRVPPFQRTFTWKSETIVQLWDDLLQTMADPRPNRILFLGPLVFSQDGKETWLVDGQQRLTTLSLIAAAIRHKLHPGGKSDEEANEISRLRFRAEDLLFVRSGASKELRLTLSQHDNSAFGEYVATGKAGLPPKILASAYLKVTQLLEESVKTTSIREFADALLQTLEEAVVFAEVNVSDPCDPYSVFEALNSKGEELLQADLIKNWILHEGEEGDRPELIRRWELLSGVIPRGKLGRFLRAWWISQEEFVSQKQLYKRVRPAIRGAAAAREYLKRWSEDARFYRWLTEVDVRGERIDPRVRAALDDFSLLGFEQGKAILLSFFIKDARTLVPQATQELSRIYIRVLKSAQRRGSIFEKHLGPLCRAIKADPEDGLAHLRRVANELCHDAGQLDWRSLYVGDPGLQKYLLTSISRHPSLDGPAYQAPPTIEVEHVLPQIRRSNYLPNIDTDDYERLVEHIGNLSLVLDEDNARCSNKVFKEKIATYREYTPSGTKLPTITGQLSTLSGFGEDEVYSRAIQFAKLAENIWPMHSESKTSGKGDDRATKVVRAARQSEEMALGDAPSESGRSVPLALVAETATEVRLSRGGSTNEGGQGKYGSRSPSSRSWTRDVLELVGRFGDKEFTLNEAYAFESELFALHSTNKNIRPKIRQQLQTLCKAGLLKRVRRGAYQRA